MRSGVGKNGKYEGKENNFIGRNVSICASRDGDRGSQNQNRLRPCGGQFDSLSRVHSVIRHEAIFDTPGQSHDRAERSDYAAGFVKPVGMAIRIKPEADVDYATLATTFDFSTIHL